jgi:hypothetical protein
MKRFRYGLFLISIFLSAPSWAQDCRIRFSIGYSDGKKIQMGLTHDQTRFWQRDSEKVYSGLCLDWTKPSYAIIWTESLSGEGAVESVVQELNRITAVASSLHTVSPLSPSIAVVTSTQLHNRTLVLFLRFVFHSLGVPDAKTSRKASE